MSETELDFDADELAMLRQLFRDEANDALETVTTRVLASGSTRPSADALTEMMRVTHTLKGAAGTVGLGGMVDLSHRFEDALARLGKGAPWTLSSADLIVEITDGLRAYLERQIAGDVAGAESLARQVIDRVDRLGAGKQTRELSPVGSSTSSPGIAIPEFAPTASRTAPTRPSDSRIDVSLEPPRAPRPRTPSTPPRFGHDEPSAGDSMTMPIPTIVEEGLPLESGPIPVLRRADSASDVSTAHAEPKGFLRVEPERIDALMSSAGELLFDRTRIERRVQLLRTLARDLARTRQTLRDTLGTDGPPSRAAIAQTETELASQATLLSQTTAALLDEIEALRRTIGELQRGLTRIRMESARRLMSHAARTLRALHRATGVRVELRTVGEDTEFDKAVAEQLLDPITQLLRNAVAHGVEPPEERIARGKPPIATITLRARQDGNLLILEVADDGRGVDTRALRDRLVATGHWSEARGELASDSDVLDALLGTGVSVRDDADSLAGRGIGVGLVRETVAKLGGELSLSSLPGRGTTFSLKLPLSTALAQAMLFKVGGQVYAIPAVHVVDTALVEPNTTSTTFRHDQVPVVRLEGILGNGLTGDRRPGVVVSFAGKVLIATVDKIVGPREIIVKPLGALLDPLTLYAGATISGSGKIQLILDPAQLVHRAYPDAPNAAIVDHGSAPAVLAGRALVVDDSRAIREAMTSMLGREGWIVDVAEDGARAIAMAKQLRYDLVVTDLEMPELDGWQLLAHLRKDERYKHVPAIIITSRASPEHRRRAKELDVRALVAKPITRRKLLEALAAK